MLTFTVICTIGLFYVINAAILWVKPAETPPFCRQNSQDIMSILYNIHYIIIYYIYYFVIRHMTRGRS